MDSGDGDNLRDVIESFYGRQPLTDVESRWEMTQRAETRIRDYCRRRRRVRIRRSSSAEDTASATSSEDALIAAGLYHSPIDHVEPGDVEVIFERGAVFGMHLKLLMKRRPRIIVVCAIKPTSPAFGKVRVGDAVVAWREGAIQELLVGRATAAKLSADFFAEFVDRLVTADRPLSLTFRHATRFIRGDSSVTMAKAELSRVVESPTSTVKSRSLDSTRSPVTGKTASEAARDAIDKLTSQLQGFGPFNFITIKGPAPC